MASVWVLSKVEEDSCVQGCEEEWVEGVYTSPEAAHRAVTDNTTEWLEPEPWRKNGCWQVRWEGGYYQLDHTEVVDHPAQPAAAVKGET